jgi:hypothetical protein
MTSTFDAVMLIAGAVLVVVGVLIQFGIGPAVIVAGVATVALGYAIDFDEGDNPS